MKHGSLYGVLLLLCAASGASAAPGLNLRWSACFGDAGTVNRTFACDSNTGTNELFGSFELGQMIYAKSLEGILDITVSESTLPAWWAFMNPGSCRTASLTVNVHPLPTAVNCIDWADGVGAGAIAAYEVGAHGPNTARIRVVEARPSPFEPHVDAVEYFAFRLAVNNAKTVDAGCGGCSATACIVFNQLKIGAELPTATHSLVGPTNLADSFFTTWQGGPGNHVCPQLTPTRRSSWSEVKSLYR